MLFYTNEIIKFILNEVKFTMSDFKHQTISEPYPLHYHGKDSFEIHFIKNGSGKAIIDNNCYEINQDSYYTTSSYIVHGQMPNENDVIEKYSIYFTVDSTKASNEIKRFLTTPYIIGKIDFDCFQILENIEKEFVNKNPLYIDVVADYLKILLINLARQNNVFIEVNKAKDTSNIVFEIETIMLNEFQTITLGDLAKRLNLGERTLQRLLNELFNKSFNTLKFEARMAYATKELMHSNKSIAEISEIAGYSSCEHFSYTFKKHHKISPLKFRNNSKKLLKSVELCKLDREEEKNE